MRDTPVREPTTKTIHYVTPVPRRAATGLTAKVYTQMQADFMHAPLLTVHSPVPPLLAGVWSMLRETLLAGEVDRTYKEVVAATVSKTNACPFCIEAHTVMLHATSNHDVADAIHHGAYDRIDDQRLHALVQWVLTYQTEPVEERTPPPFSEQDRPEIIGTAVAFHYINRMVNIFLADTILPLPSMLKGVAHRLYAATAGKRIVRRLPQGASLRFIPQAPLPDDLSWAAANTAVAGAFAGLAAVIDETGAQVLSESVRVLVCERVQAWNGETMSMSRSWVEEAVGELRSEHRAVGRLALLTALASYQVDSGIIGAFRATHPQDNHLIAVTAWASFAVARRVGMWYAAPVALAGREV